MKITMILCLLLLLVACDIGNNPYRDANDSTPKGDPAFTPLSTSWVIDNENVLSKETIARGDQICNDLKSDGIAEVIVLVQGGIKHPEDYATHYGRWLGLGKKGSSSSGGNNGIVWLIRPDAKEKITVSVGRGLPKFTSIDYGKIIDDSIDYFNFNNYDSGLITLLSETDKRIRELYPKK